MKELLAAILAMYTGKAMTKDDILVMADPHTTDVWAVRWIKPEADFLITTHGDPETNFVDKMRAVESIEEVVFSSWPPKTAGGLSNATC